MKGMRMMGRAERRRAQKLEQKAKTATYNLTKAQLDAAVREQVGKELERIKQEAMDDAVNTAMVSAPDSAAGSADGPLLDEILRKAHSKVYRAGSGILRTLAKW